ncbi:MAG: transcriptional regulator [Rhodospirillales bacterium]|jgi:putative transcriptional regulator|nr:transcriptional regulator [Rhodospirillales bacterium]
MKPSHHPNDEIVMRYAAGTLSEGVSLVIGVHMKMCDTCRAHAETFETLGGLVLDTLEPAPMTPDAYAKVLQRIDAIDRMPVAEAESAPKEISPGEIVPGLPIPAHMRGYRIGRWRALAPGLKFSRITAQTKSEAKNDMNVFMLRAAPGTSLPEHGHSGNEYLCVLKGSFTDQAGSHQPGDMAMADADIAHKPNVDMNGECICVVALEGKLRLRSLIGRVLQPVYGL